VRVFAWSMLALAMSSGVAKADVIYQNNTDFILPGGKLNYVPFRDDGTPNRPHGSQLGQTVTFAGTARQLDSVVLGAHNGFGPIITYTLDLYAGANPNTAALLGSASVIVPSGFARMIVFEFGGLAVPDTVTFVVHSSNTDTLTGPISSNIAPTIGSGPNSLFYGDGPGTFTADDSWAIADGAKTNYLVAQFNASTPAVPEPASLTMLGLGALGFVGYTWRRHAGSPPTCVGKTCLPPSREELVQFTPTCVGKTVYRKLSTNTSPVHPHVRGEDDMLGEVCIGLVGSPPRAWGRRDDRCPGHWQSRFTPTCVGKTTTSGFSARPSPVHPHVRGEDNCAILDPLANVGSPPRAWGRRPRAARKARSQRFTPTCVGKTC
jgi:hypothetical protein